MNLSAMSVVAALAVDGVVTLPVAPNVQTAPGTNAVALGPAVAGAAANDVAVPEVMIAMGQEAAAGRVTGGE